MNGRRRFLAASVISVQNSSFVYPSCQNCFSRLHLDLERYSCLKCGRSGEAREANYRYRLSLEVADAHRVFQVTVFGRCLEAFFGATAKSLQRYIEDLNPEAGEASPRVLIQAVETCFIGKKFIFGVKDFKKQDGVGCLQNNYQASHCPKALTACQMFLPSPRLMGCTVLRYLHQHQCSSGSKGSHGGGWSPGGLFAALDQPSSVLSSLPSSGDRDMVPSTHAHCLSSLWSQSFGLTSSSISGGTAVDPAALGSRRTAYNEPKWDNGPVSLQRCNQSIDNSQDDSLTVNGRNVKEGDKIYLQNSISKTKDAQSLSSESTDCEALQNPLEIGKKDSPGSISIQHSRGLGKSQNPLQGHSFCPVVSCGSHSGDGRSSQDDPWFWEELPSSESLNEFVARTENYSTMVSPTEMRAQRSERAGEIHGHVNRSPQLDTPSPTGQAQEKLQEVAEKAGTYKASVLFCHPSNQLSLSGKGYQQEVSFGTLSTQGKDELKCLSNHHQILFPLLSPVGIKPCGLKGSHLSSKEGVNQHVTGHDNHHASSSSLKAASSCLKSPAHLNCMCEDNVTGWGKEESSRSEPKHTACEKLEKVSEGQPLPEVHENPCKGVETSDLLQDASICPQGSYNASAELFDASATGTLSMGQAFSAPGSALAAKPTAFGYKPSESETSWNTSQCGLSLLDLFATSDPKASTPVAGSAHEMECSVLSTQDFVPSSQSTPRVQLWQQARLPQRKESVLSELPLNGLPWIDAKRKRPRPDFKSPLVKQLVRKFLQSRRSSDVSSAARDTSVRRSLFINNSPDQVLSENYSVEWIPPSEKKQRQPLPFQTEQTVASRRNWDITENTPFSEKQTTWENPRGDTGLARTELSPKNQQPTEFNEDVADPEQVTMASPGFCTYSRSNLSSTSHPTPSAMNLSPELFGDNSQLLATEATS